MTSLGRTRSRLCDSKAELGPEGPPGRKQAWRKAVTAQGHRARMETKVSKFYPPKQATPLRSGVKRERLPPCRASKTAFPAFLQRSGGRTASGKCHPPTSARFLHLLLSLSTCHSLIPVQQAWGFLEQSKTQGQVVPQQRHQRSCRRMHCHEAHTKPSK